MSSGIIILSKLTLRNLNLTRLFALFLPHGNCKINILTCTVTLIMVLHELELDYLRFVWGVIAEVSPTVAIKVINMPLSQLSQSTSITCSTYE